METSDDSYFETSWSFIGSANLPGRIISIGFFQSGRNLTQWGSKEVLSARSLPHVYLPQRSCPLSYCSLLPVPRAADVF